MLPFGPADRGAGRSSFQVTEVKKVSRVQQDRGPGVRGSWEARGRDLLGCGQGLKGSVAEHRSRDLVEHAGGVQKSPCTRTEVAPRRDWVPGMSQLIGMGTRESRDWAY